MKLLIISHTPHYRHGDQILGWGPTLREIDALATRFESIVHIAPLHQEPAPESSLPYSARNIIYRNVNPAGGNTLREKFSILFRIPEYVRIIRKEMKQADMIHVRCPAAISLIGLLILFFSPSPKYRWVKYAGNWNPGSKDPFSYTLQRWIIAKNLHRGVVTINGEWPNQPDHIYSFLNPSLTDDDVVIGNKKGLEKVLRAPYHFLFVGRLESAKGVNYILEIGAQLRNEGLDFVIDLIGDGPDRTYFEKQAFDLDIVNDVHFHGWLPRNAVNPFLQDAHFILLPSRASEGWPKVLSEAMASGVVVIASNISSIPQILKKTNAGYALDPNSIDQYIETINRLIHKPEKWKEMSENGIHSSSLFTYNSYLDHLQRMIKDAWDISIH